MTDSRHWCAALFGIIDSRDSRGFATYLTPDAQFRYGSAPAVTGSAAIAQALEAFFAGIAALSHRVTDIWEVPGHLICRGDVVYTRLDGKTVTAPFCNVFTMRGEKVAHYEIYLDPTPLSAP